MGKISDNLSEDLMYYTLEYFVTHEKARHNEVWDFFKNNPKTPLFTEQNIRDAVNSHSANKMIEFSAASDSGKIYIDNKEYKILPRGIYTYENAKRERERVLALEEMSLQTAKSTIDLATHTKYYNNRNLMIAGASVIFIALTFFQQCNDKTEKELQNLRIEVQKSSQAIQDIQTCLQEINSSIQNKNDDTTLVRVVDK